MAEDKSQDVDQSGENWLSSFEEECLEDLDREPNMEDRIQAEREFSTQKLWLGFQNSASCIAQLYKDRYQGLSLWVPFQNSAASVTSMYKDSLETMKRCMDLGYQYGRQHRNKDIVSWAKKKRRLIRREDLLGYIAGRSPPHRNRLSSAVSRPVSRLQVDRASPRLHGAVGVEVLPNSPEPDLQPFRDALVLQGLNGAMSNVSVGYLPHGSTGASVRNNSDELNCFILEELSRCCEGRKRNSSADVMMDSPARKRGRLT